MLKTKYQTDSGNVTLAGFLRLFGSNVFSGIVHYSLIDEKEVIFLKINIFWYEPIFLAIDFHGNLIDDNCDNSERAEMFYMLVDEDQEVMYLYDILKDYNLEINIFNKVIMYSYEYYKSLKETSIKDCWSFYKKLSYHNITCYKIQYQDVPGEIFLLTKIFLCYHGQYDACYILLNSEGCQVSVHENFKELYEEISEGKEKVTRYLLSDLLPVHSMNNVILNMYNSIHQIQNTSTA